MLPSVTPVAIPLPLLMLSTEGLALVHTPSGCSFVCTIVNPGHTAVGPPISDGRPFTVTTVVRIQPFAVAYVMLVVPAAIPFTTPPALMVAIVVALVHVPPPVALSSVVVWPAHTSCTPVMGSGNGFTTSDAVRIHPVGKV